MLGQSIFTRWTTQDLAQKVTGLLIVVVIFGVGNAFAEDRLNSIRNYEVGWDLYSYSRQERLGLHGGGLSFAAHINKDFAMVADFGGHRAVDGNAALDLYTYRFGPRLTLPAGQRVTWFSHVLIGGVTATPKVQFGSSALTIGSESGLSLALGSGVDIGIRPWIAIRPMGEYVFDNFRMSGVHSNGFRVGGGLVFKFGEVNE